MRYLIFILCFFPALAWAVVDITAVRGASAFEDSTTTNPIIYGGVAGADCGSGNTDTCNSCVSGELKVCNPARIFNNLILEIQYTSEEAGTTAVSNSSGSTTGAITLQTGGTTGSIPAGQTHRARILWSDLCSRLNSGNNDCAANTFSGTVTLGVDTSGGDGIPDGTTQNVTIKVNVPVAGSDTVPHCDSGATRGLCQFVAYPGDEKIYLEQLQAATAGNFPSDNNRQFTFVRVIFSDQTFSETALNPRTSMDAGLYRDLPIEAGANNTDPALADKVVDGLANNTLYFFRIMLVDAAKNISDITDNTVYTGDTNCGADLANPTNAFDCPLTAIPDEVFGLLAEDFNCFISTVAYGSTMAPKVKDFRQFRKMFLVPSSWGRQLNRWYYQYGSQASQWIAKHEAFKALARVALFPIWIFAKLSLKWGLVASITTFFGLLVVGFASLIWGLKKWRGALS